MSTTCPNCADKDRSIRELQASVDAWRASYKAAVAHCAQTTKPVEPPPLPRVGYCVGSGGRGHFTNIEWQGCYTICTHCKMPLNYVDVSEIERRFNIKRPTWWPERVIGWKGWKR